MNLAWGAILNAEERGKLVEAARAIGCDPSRLSACIAFESRWDPAAYNAASGASGLIQFMPGPRGSAVALGTTTDAIRRMSRVEQLELVRRYFAPYVGKLRTLSDVYMAILWPRAVGKPEDYVLFSAADTESRAYVQNKGLDVNADGVITKAEATAFVARRLQEGLLPQNAADSETQPAAPIVDAGRPYNPEPALATFRAADAPTGAPMDPISIVGIVGTALQLLIPQVGKLFGGAKDAKNAQIIGTVLDTVVQAAGTAALGEKATLASTATAVEKMQADPALAKSVQQAVVTQPEIMGALQIVEVGGGPAAARADDAKQAQQEKPFWKTSAVFWVSVLLMPMVYWLVGSLIVGGIAPKALQAAHEMGVDLPGWVLLVLSLFGDAWQGETRSGGFNLVVGLVLGGICGVYFGVSVTQAKQAAQAAAADKA